jgi:hypothetical protein
MNSVRFNKAKKEIEIIGSRSFVESHLDVIGKFPLGSSGEGDVKGAARTRAHWRVTISVGAGEPRKTGATRAPKGSDAAPAERKAPSARAEAPQGAAVKRPPVRKYFNTSGKLIRSESTAAEASAQNAVVDAVEHTPKGMSISALKEKFGLSEDKVKEILDEAEKQGKVRRDMDGSFVWV